jgi:hypothetical protein
MKMSAENADQTYNSDKHAYLLEFSLFLGLDYIKLKPIFNKKMCSGFPRVTGSNSYCF